MFVSRRVMMSAVLGLIALHGSTPILAQAPAVRGNPARGRYIVEGVAMCGECHSTRDGSGAIIPSTRLMGGPMPVRPAWNIDWAVRTPRIAGLPGYTDELAVRLLTQGAIGRDDTQLRPPMPRFRMTPQDAADVVAYLKSPP
ncbi:MAG: cytochrome c [Acidobacteria bacterium]|nr:cytochrome c [Acidobacteriota bacterium]